MDQVNLYLEIEIEDIKVMKNIQQFKVEIQKLLKEHTNKLQMYEYQFNRVTQINLVGLSPNDILARNQQI